LILASGSPRRAELLRAAGFEFDVVVADVDESVRAGELPSVDVRRLAADKSAAVQARRRDGTAKAVPYGKAMADGQATPDGQAVPDGQPVPNERVGSAPRTSVGPRFSGADSAAAPIILGADTTVVVDGEILGKPRDDAEVAAMLRKLSGKRHNVLTGISLRQGAYEVGRVETTEVVFRELSEDEVEWYVASGEGRDKAGAYAIQGRAARFIPRIDGSYSNVVGLPIAAVAELMRSHLASRLTTDYSGPGSLSRKSL
jgi:septum formation protein